jgi:hypothetical protein
MIEKTQEVSEAILTINGQMKIKAILNKNSTIGSIVDFLKQKIIGLSLVKVEGFVIDREKPVLYLNGTVSSKDVDYNDIFASIKKAGQKAGLNFEIVG